jgi:hypothetical protein
MTSLSQVLSLVSMKAYVSKKDDTFTLMEPFSYVCSVKRVSGRRFLNFEHGLEATGDCERLENKSQSLTFHAGKKEMTIVANVLGKVVESTAEETKTSDFEGNPSGCPGWSHLHAWMKAWIPVPASLSLFQL